MNDSLADRLPLPDGWMPEGIERGPEATVFVGSLADGAIWRGDLRTGAGDVLVPGIAGTMCAGICYEPAHDRIWCAYAGRGEVRVFDASSGALLERYRPDGPLASANDVAVTPRAVYATDTYRARLIVISREANGTLPPASAATFLELGGDYVQVGDETTVNLNGIVAVGDVILVAQSETGKLFRVDPATGVATLVDLGGVGLGRPDGLELDGETLYSVSNREDRVVVVALDRGFTRGSVIGELTDPSLDFPTTAVVTLGHLWAVNLRLTTTPPGPDVSYWITRLPLHRD